MHQAAHEPCLALQTYNNYLHIYGLHVSKDLILPASPLLSSPELKRHDIYLQYSFPVSSSGATATALVGDSRSVVVGLSDGNLAAYSWQAKVRISTPGLGPAVLLAIMYNPGLSTEGLKLRVQVS